MNLATKFLLENLAAFLACGLCLAAWLWLLYGVLGWAFGVMP